MFLDAHVCTETVSILEAIAFGADGACIDIGMTSLLSAVAGFVGAVVMIRFVAMRVLRRAVPGLRRSGRPVTQGETEVEDAELKPLPYESPIRSTGAWGRRGR